MVTVSKEQGADFTTVSAALEYAEHEYQQAGEAWRGETIFIRNGRYEERVEVKIPGLMLIGESCRETVISGCLYALMYCEDIGKLGTFRTYTMMVDTHDVLVMNLCVENTAGFGPDKGQAIALFAEGDRLVFENCRFLGNTDTVYTGPLPPYELKKNGFVGPKQFAPRVNGRQYYRDCYIEGDVDFIFGSATAYFENCTLFQKNHNQEVNSYATAASTAEGQEYGYVFASCRFLSDAAPGTCYLGRPWRNFAKTVILNSYLGAQIRPEGWHNWNKPEAEKTVYYAEYNNYGAGSIPERRPGWVSFLSEEEARHYTREHVLGRSDGWKKKGRNL